MKKRQIALLLLLFPAIVFANGGPMDWSKVISTGNIVMKNVQNVKIQSERIDVKIEGDYAIYDIVYMLKKERSYDVDTVTYGFPVDYERDSYSEDYVFEESYIPYFKIYFQGKELPIIEQIDFNEFLGKDAIYYQLNGNDTLIEFNRYKRKWYISEMIFNEDGLYELRVQYKVKNKYEDYIVTKSIIPMFDSRYLTYDFTAASYWGKEGVIDTFYVKIDLQELVNLGESYTISGLDSSMAINGIYEFKKMGFDLKKNHSFNMSYSVGLQAYSDYILKFRIPNEIIKSVNSNRSQDNDNLKKLLDLDFCSSYQSENVFKSGENWLEFEFDTLPIAGIYFLNQDFNNLSNQISKIKVEIWAISSWMDVDELGNQTNGIKEKKEFVIKLGKHDSKKLMLNNFADNADLIFDYGAEGIPMYKVRITILDISGDKSKGFSIPEIIFTDYQWFYKNSQNKNR